MSKISQDIEELWPTLEAGFRYLGRSSSAGGTLMAEDRSLDSAIAHCNALGWQWQLRPRKSEVGEHMLIVATILTSEHSAERYSGPVTPGEALWRAIEMANESEAAMALLAAADQRAGRGGAG